MVVHVTAFFLLLIRISMTYVLPVVVSLTRLICIVIIVLLWSAAEWSHVQAYIDELQQQRERKKERK